MAWEICPECKGHVPHETLRGALRAAGWRCVFDMACPRCGKPIRALTELRLVFRLVRAIETIEVVDSAGKGAA